MRCKLLLQGGLRSRTCRLNCEQAKLCEFNATCTQIPSHSSPVVIRVPRLQLVVPLELRHFLSFDQNEGREIFSDCFE